MKLVIVESPAKAKTINKYLGNDYKVIASYGHIRDLPSKNGSVRPEDDFAMDYAVSPSSAKQVKAIADAVKGAEELYLATDPDREGEAISWHLVEVLRQKRALKKSVPVKRIVFYEITKSAVNEAIKNPRDIDMDLVNSQQARRALDYLVGFTLSPVLWRKLPGSRSAGRVQSVALKLVCEREAEIETFNSREYWSIMVQLESAKKELIETKLVSWNQKKLEQFDITNDKEAEAIASAIKGQSFNVSDIQSKQVKRHPQPPFITSSMQQEAARKLGFSTRQTMQVAQQLYEGIELGGETVGLITYMRTDGVTVSKEALAQTASVIESQYGPEYKPAKFRAYASKAKNAQEAHEAIRPTDVRRKPSDIKSYLNADQFKLYSLIWKRMLASQMESAILNQVSLEFTSDDQKAVTKATGSTVHFEGFFAVYREGRDDSKDDDEDKLLPAVTKGEGLEALKIEPKQHFTQPPPRFTEASLVKRLEELGIGRPSTYSAIISVLQDRNYVLLEKRRFIAEDRGRIVTAFLSSFFEQYVEYDFTAKLEEDLDLVSDGKGEWKELLRRFWTDFEHHIGSVSELSTTDVIHELNIILGDYLFERDDDGELKRDCPDCADGRLSLKLGKFGAFLGCSNYPDCRYTKQLGSNEADNDDGQGDASVDRLLGYFEDSKREVHLKKGPYGFYIELDAEEEKAKPKRVALPKSFTPADVELEQATNLLQLPREIGTHPETSKVIKAGIGRFGPYILHDGKYVSLKDDDVLTVGMNRAVDLIASASAGKAKAEPIRTLGKHPDSGEDIAVYEGRYGPYIKFQKLNVSLPKGKEVDSLTMDEAVELITKKQASAKKKPTRKKKK